MDELDTQLMEDLKAQNERAEQTEQVEVQPEVQETQETQEEVKPEEVKPKVFDEDYVKGLRAENAKYRRQLRDEQARNQNVNVPVYPNAQYPNAQYPTGYPQGYPNGPIYDPRVDQILAEQEDTKLNNKLTEIKADPYFGELFNEYDDEGRTFEERLLEKAVETQWPIAELDALVFKMEKNKLIGRVKQKGIDEAYNSMKNKSANAPERAVSSGKIIESGEINNVDDAIRAAMKDNGVTSLKELR